MPPMASRRNAERGLRRPGRGVLVALGLACAAAGATTPAPSPRSLRWPLEVPGALLSSFGEYRYDHLHAGIDISTGGGTGHKVLAADAGEVFRLKVEWRGYGRALYLRHAGGRVTVYGHLERYEDRVLGLERLVAGRQAAAGTRYPGDIYLERPRRVARGQVVAYSGESGVGLPHLHFEVRDRGDAPVDPFQAGLTRPKDRRPPLLESLIVTAASGAAFLDGEARERIYPLKPGEGRVRTTDLPVRVSGPFLAALTASDPAGATGRAGVAGIEARLDGQIVYRLALQSFRFAQYPQAGLVFDHRYSRLGPAAFTYRLFRLPGNELATGPAGAAPTPGDVYPGAFDLPPGPHLLEIVVSDSAGNRSRARVCVQMGRPRIAESLEWDGPAAGSVRALFPPAAAGPADSAARGGGAAVRCPAPGRGLEGELWSPGRRAFRPLECRADDGTCALPAGPGESGGSIVRLREIRDGVPGPWRLFARDGASGRVPETVSARVEAWPSFLDVVVPLDPSPAPRLWLAAGLGRTPLVELAYRGGATYAASLSSARAAGLAPFSVVAEGSSLPLAALVLDARWSEPGRPIDYRGPGFSLHLPERARFFAGPLVVRSERIAGPGRLPAIADAIDLLPEGEVLDERASLAFDLSPGLIAPESLGIYRWDGSRGRWSYEGGEPEDDGSRITLKLRRYGRFALLQDAAPPDLLEVRPGPGSVVATRRPAFLARVEDEGKGLGFDGVAFELDGRRLDSEFDPDRGQAKVLDPPLLLPGPHHLRVVATDLAGNASPPAEVDFEIKPRVRAR